MRLTPIEFERVGATAEPRATDLRHGQVRAWLGTSGHGERGFFCAYINGCAFPTRFPVK